MNPGNMKKKELDRRMEAESVSQLKYMLEIELGRLRDRSDIDMILFMGTGGRIFSSSIPEDLTPTQYRLLNTFKSNIPYLAGKLKGENLDISVERWDEGMAIVVSVGEYAFIASILSKKSSLGDMGSLLEDVVNTSQVIKHIFEQKPLDEESLSQYSEEVKDELNKLSRQLFVDRFKHTRKYKKNMKILDFIKSKIEKTIGVGSVDQAVSMTFNQLGTSAPYMDEQMWYKFLDKIVDEHVRGMIGDIQAEEYKRQWRTELEQKLKSFL
ncbi:MAG: hypothetical protein ACQESD_01035 [Thermoplasmatota archaeon]